MTSPFDGFEVEKALRPSARGVSFDLARSLASLVILHARVPADAFTAQTLGQERLGNDIVIGKNGLILTIGYLVTEAHEVTLLTNDGRRVPAHPLGIDPVTMLVLPRWHASSSRCTCEQDDSTDTSSRRTASSSELLTSMCPL